MITRRTLLATAAALPVTVLLSTPVLADTPQIYAPNGAAIGGYDPVAYFTQGNPVQGDPAYSVEHDGAVWRFSSARNKAMFEENPAKYAPQYGGYCAYAVSEGYTAKTDPDAWTVHEGKLYLNYSKSVRARWSKDIPGRVARGDANWPKVLN